MIVICTICSELANHSQILYVTECGHLFHFDCLNSWIIRSKTCPQCRNRVTEKCMFRFYPTTSDAIDSKEETAAMLQMQLDNVLLQLNQQSKNIKSFKARLDSANISLQNYEDIVKDLEQVVKSKESALAAHKEQINHLKSENEQLKKKQKELESHKKSLDLLQGLQKVLNATVGEVEDMLQGYPDVRTVTTFAIALKKALMESETKMSELRNRMQLSRQEVAQEKMKYSELKLKYRKLEDEFNISRQCNEVLNFKDNEVEKSLKNKESTVKILHTSVTTSLSTKVKKRIDDADQLNLKQSNLAWATMRNPTTSRRLIDKAQATLQISLELEESPTRVPVLNIGKGQEHSIFRERKNNGVELPMFDVNESKHYDGLGSHTAYSDEFPKPRAPRAPKKETSRLTLKRSISEPNRNISMKKYLKAKVTNK